MQVLLGEYAELPVDNEQCPVKTSDTVVYDAYLTNFIIIVHYYN